MLRFPFIGVLISCSIGVEPLARAQVVPPASSPSSVAQTEKAKEHNRLWAEAQKHRTEGKLTEAIAAGRKALAIKRELLAADAEDLLVSFQWLADVAEQAEYWAAVETFRDDALAWCTKYRGAEHWTTVDARFALENAKKLKTLSPAQRSDLQRATQLHDQVFRLYRQGKFLEAINHAAETCDLRKRILGEVHPLYATSLNNLAAMYHNSGDYTRAEPLYVQSTEIRKRILGEEHPDYASSLNNLAELYRRMRNYVRAEPLCVQATEIRKRTLGENHPAYSQSLNNLALLYDSMGNYARAEPLYVESIEIRKRSLSQNHPDYATSLNNLAGMYQAKGEYSRAEALYLQATEARKRTIGVNHPDYAASLGSLAVLYQIMGDFAKAEPLCLQAAEIRKRTLGENHPAYAQSLNTLAALYIDTGDDGRAERLSLQASEICKRTLGESHPDYAMSLNHLALLYQNIGSYARAETLYAQSTEIRRRALGESHPDFANSLNNLAGLYDHLGDYARAEPLHLRAAEILKRTQGENHPNYANSLNNLALLYWNMGDYARAESLCIQSTEIRKRTLGEHHPDYAQSLNNLASLYWKMEDYARAEPMFVQSIDIYRRTLGKNHPGYAQSLNNLASLYINVRDYARAEPLCVESAEIRKQAIGVNHPSYAASLNSLATVYWRMGDYVRAEPLQIQSAQVFKRTLGEHHPEYATSLNNLAKLYASTDRPMEADPLYRQVLAISRKSLETSAAVQSERQQLAMGQALRHQLDGYLSFGVHSESFSREIFGEVLTWKGSTLMRQRGMRLAADDPTVADLFSQLQRTAGQLAALSRTFPTKDDARLAWRERMAALTADKERLEAQLSAKSAAFREATKEVSIYDLLAALPTDAVLVDYLEFTRSTPPTEKGKPTTFERELVAFVVRHAERPDNQVVMVPLGPVAPIGAAIDRWRATFGAGDDAVAAGAELRKLVWEPVLPTMNDERGTMNEEASGRSSLIVPTSDFPTVLVSTDGVLGRLPLGALPGKEPGTYLIEDHRLAMIPVPQLLPALTAVEDRTPTHELLLLGDVDYDAAPGITRTPTDSQLATAHGSVGLRAPKSGNERFAPLPGTKSEVEAIERLFRAAQPDGRLVTLGTTEATEARFRELAPQCRMLHLATHGFFAPEQFKSAAASDTTNPAHASLGEQETTVVGYSPNLLSGLVLAGANRPPRDDGDDGILTAEEIASLRLEGARLVTLSACETGLGETAGGEGLLGLQRAFQVSGARTTIASFWKVDDQVTRELMERFYRNLQPGPDGKPMSMLDALREAQLWILRHPQDVAAALRSRGADPPEDDPGLMTSPRYWAAFSLSGDWR